MTIRARSNEFLLSIVSTTLGAGTLGTSVTPGNNTYGSWVQLLAGAAVTENAYGMWIGINTFAVSGSARDNLINIGFDPAGGASYTVVVADLYGSCAGGVGGAGLGGCWYFLPLGVKAGTSIAAQASVNNATVGTGFVYVKLLCRPTRPELVRAGSFVRTFGSTPASSSGTSITPGNSSKGAYVQLGAATAEPLFFLTSGYGVNNAAFNSNAAIVDLAVGDATNKRIVVADQPIITSASEVIAYTFPGAWTQPAVGDLIYTRAMSAGAPVTGWSAIAYGVGG